VDISDVSGYPGHADQLGPVPTRQIAVMFNRGAIEILEIRRQLIEAKSGGMRGGNMELSPEDRRRIFEEEKRRLADEYRAEVRHQRVGRPPTGGRNLVPLGLIALAVVTAGAGFLFCLCGSPSRNASSAIRRFRATFRRNRNDQTADRRSKA
jgi:hypothetical protein